MHEDLRKFCPVCEPHFNRHGQRIGVYLELIRDNYSGCGVDHCRCPECEQMFQVTYKIDDITPMDK